MLELEKFKTALTRGLSQPDVVALFVVLSTLQALLSVVAWCSSSGYEDSAIPYLLQFILGLMVLGCLGWQAWLTRKKNPPQS